MLVACRVSGRLSLMICRASSRRVARCATRAADRAQGWSATAASGVATWKLKLSTRYRRTPLVVVLVSDRQILAAVEQEVAAAEADHDRAVQAGRPDDRALDDLAQVFDQWVATVFGGLADRVSASCPSASPYGPPIPLGATP